SQYSGKSSKLSRSEALCSHQPVCPRPPRFHSRASPLVSRRVQSHPEKQNGAPMDPPVCQSAPRTPAPRLSPQTARSSPLPASLSPLHFAEVESRLSLTPCELPYSSFLNSSPKLSCSSSQSAYSFRRRAPLLSPRLRQSGPPTVATPVALVSRQPPKSINPTS